MKNNRILNIEINDVLDLIYCAQDYGHGGDILFATFRDWLDYKLTDEEIKNYASEYLTKESIALGYTQEDYENALEILNEFKKKYIK